LQFLVTLYQKLYPFTELMILSTWRWRRLARVLMTQVVSASTGMTSLFAGAALDHQASKYEICQESYNIVLPTLAEPFYIIYEASIVNDTLTCLYRRVNGG